MDVDRICYTALLHLALLGVRCGVSLFCNY